MTGRTREPATDPERVRVQKVVPGGEGLVRREAGQALLIAGALPGDLVQVRRTRKHAGVLRALEWELLEPGPDRVAPVCEVAARCGGCDFMSLNDAAQDRAKLELFHDALERIGHIDATLLPRDLTRAGPRLGYRSRLRLQITAKGAIGFYKQGTHDLVEPSRCHVARAEILQALGALRRLTRRGPEVLAPFAFVELRVSSRGVAFFFALRPDVPWLPVECQAALRRLGRDHVVATSVDANPPYERFDLNDEVYMYAAPGTFTQVNWAVNQLLVMRLSELGRGAAPRDFLDLYCGCGNFTLPLLALGFSGIGVEASRPAIAAASLAAQEQQFGGRFVVDDAIRYATAASREGRSYDLVVVDPPRAGVKAGLGAIGGIARTHLALVGCDPVTFARDLRGFIDSGFSLEHLEAFDMFPQTHHLEAFAWLKKRL